MWRLIAPALACALLGASFFRAGNEIMVLACVGLLALLAVPRRWAALAVQGALVLGALRWIFLAWMIGAARAAAGAPYLRMALILGAVALFTLLAALVFRSARLRAFYRRAPGGAG